MIKFTLQTSEDGKVWTDTDQTFNTKKAAREKMDELETEGGSNALDWRVGFLLRLRSGKWYRVMDENGILVRFS